MEEVKLPLVPVSTTLSAAMDALRLAKRGALLATHGDQCFLIGAGHIVVGRSKGIETLSELAKTSIVTLPKTPKVQQVFESMVRSIRIGRTDEPDYLLTEIVGNLGVVAFGDKQLAARYVSPPKDYYCDGPRHHDDFPPPDVSVGDDCPRRDGYKIVSSV